MSDSYKYDIFISYAHADSRWVFAFVEDLRDSGFTIWLDRDSIPLGKEWRNSIRKGIEESRLFLLVVSPNAAGSREVERERDLAREFNRPIIPIIYGDGLEDLNVSADQGVDFWNTSRETAFKSLIEKLAKDYDLHAKPRPKDALRDILRDGSRTFGTLAKQWPTLHFGRRATDPVAVRYAIDTEGIGVVAYLVGATNQTVKPPETVQVFMLFTDRTTRSFFDNYLDYIHQRGQHLHTVLIRGPIDPNNDEYHMPEGRDRIEVWKQVVTFINTAVDNGTFGAQRLELYLNTPNALSFVLGDRLKLTIPYEIFHFTGKDRQRDMYVDVYQKNRRR